MGAIGPLSWLLFAAALAIIFTPTATASWAIACAALLICGVWHARWRLRLGSPGP